MVLKVLFFASFLLLTACGSVPKKKSNSAQGKYEYGLALAKAERMEEAIVEFQDIKNKFPYSRYATLSELAIADVHFQRESYVEAQGAYEVFKSLHPKHPQSDLVTYRLGLSLFKQLPSTIDRDLSVAHRAINYFSQVSRYYPTSEYIKPSLEKRTEALKMLASKELYIADFYFKKENYKSALKRYEDGLSTYADLGFDNRFLFGASASAFRSGAIEKGRKYSSSLNSRFPGSDLAQKIKDEESKYVQR